MNIAQRLQDKGRQEGMREEKIMMVRNLLKNGISLELIVESTGLSSEELISVQ